MDKFSFKIYSLIENLKRLEQVWFRIVLPTLGKIKTEAKAISDAEFAATYSEEAAEKDPYYDARRILESDWNFYVTHDQLLYARQSTIHSLFIVLGQIIEQYLIDLLCILENTQNPNNFQSFKDLVKAFRSAGIDIEKKQHWNAIMEIRYIANYLKHGVGISSKKAANILAQHIGEPHDPESETTLFSTPQLKGQAMLPSLPLRDAGIALTEETLTEYLSKTYIFFSHLGDNTAK